MTAAVFPGRYVQAPGALSAIPQEAKRLGTEALVVAGKSAIERILPGVLDDWRKTIGCAVEPFAGECSDEEIERLIAKRRQCDADFIIGMGGGKALDTAKAVAHAEGCRLAIVPTIASTDAPTSAVCVVYTPEGAFKRYVFFPTNPDLVLMDSTVIAQAPERYLVAGIGDALSTWFEADSCHKAFAKAMSGGLGTMAGQAISKLCLDTILEHGVHALLACRDGVVTPALEHVIEANTLLSGLGFESSGLASAHAIHNGLTKLEPTHHYLHGEKVAIGVLAGLFLCDRPRSMIRDIFAFCRDVGLPIKLADIGLESVSDADLQIVAEAACAKEDTIHNEPFPVTPADVVAALKSADRYGTSL